MHFEPWLIEALQQKLCCQKTGEVDQLKHILLHCWVTPISENKTIKWAPDQVLKERSLCMITA